MSFNKAGQLGFFDKMIPCYTIFHKDDETFSDIWTEWNEDFAVFYKDVCRDMKQYEDIKGIKAKPDRPDAFTPVSCVQLWDMTHRDRGRCIFRSLCLGVIIKYMTDGCCLSVSWLIMPLRMVIIRLC